MQQRHRDLAQFHCVFTFLLTQLRFYAPSCSLSCPYITSLMLLSSSYLPGKILTWLNPNLCHLHISSWGAEYVWRKTIILTGLTWTSWSLFPLGAPGSFLTTILHPLIHPSPFSYQTHVSFLLKLATVLSHTHSLTMILLLTSLKNLMDF